MKPIDTRSQSIGFHSTSNSPLSEIEKYLRNIQSQKSSINRLVFKELKEAKSGWQEIIQKTQMPSSRNFSNQSNLSNIGKLYGTLIKTTENFKNVHQSMSKMDDLKSNYSTNVSTLMHSNNKVNVETEPMYQNTFEKQEFNCKDLLTNPLVIGDHGRNEPEPYSLSTKHSLDSSTMCDNERDYYIKNYFSNIKLDYDEKKEKMQRDLDISTTFSKLNIDAIQENSSKLSPKKRFVEQEKPPSTSCKNEDILRKSTPEESKTNLQNVQSFSQHDTTYKTDSMYSKKVPDVFKSKFLRKTLSKQINF